MDPRRHIAIIIGLLAAAALVQCVLVRRAAVPALDAVRFVEIAQRIDGQGLVATMRHQRQEPLFPIWVWLVHETLQRAAGPFPAAWATSVQLAAAVAVLLSVVPVYFLSIRLVGPPGAAAGSLLFCLLPEVSRLGADGISDSLHLLLFCLAFSAAAAWFAGRQRAQGAGCRVRGSGLGGDQESIIPRFSSLIPRSSACLFVAGVLASLAVLVRAEAIVLPASLLLALLLLQLTPAARRPWPQLAVAAGALLAGCGAVFGPYLGVVGAASPRVAVERILGRYEPEDEAKTAPATPPRVPAAAGPWLLADGEPMSFAPKETGTSIRRRGYAAAAAQLAGETAEAFGYVVGALALFGLWRLRRRLVRPVDRFAHVYLLLFGLAVFYFTSREGYLSARHLLSVVVIGIGCAGHGALELGGWLGRWRRGTARGESESRGRSAAKRARPLWAWGVVALAGVACAAPSIKPLHADRLPHRLAGEWLAREDDMPGSVLDTRGWTGLYSGRPTVRYGDGPAAFCDPRLAFVVVEQAELEQETRRGRTLSRLLQIAAEPAAAFPGPVSTACGGRAVVVYRWHAGRLARWLGTQPAVAQAPSLPRQAARPLRTRLAHAP